VRGYKEEGTTTTPFDMCVMKDIDRFHLVMDVIDRVPSLPERAAYANQVRASANNLSISLIAAPPPACRSDRDLRRAVHDRQADHLALTERWRATLPPGAPDPHSGAVFFFSIDNVRPAGIKLVTALKCPNHDALREGRESWSQRDLSPEFRGLLRDRRLTRD
jgi:XFP C-terminal domain